MPVHCTCTCACACACSYYIYEYFNHYNLQLPFEWYNTINYHYNLNEPHRLLPLSTTTQPPSYTSKLHHLTLFDLHLKLSSSFAIKTNSNTTRSHTSDNHTDNHIHFNQFNSTATHPNLIISNLHINNYIKFNQSYPTTTQNTISYNPIL